MSDGYRPVLGEFHSSTPAAFRGAPDRRSGDVYLMSDELSLALNVAFVTGRPLLLRGSPGSGKSSFAPFIARNLGWSYEEHGVTSTTTAQDLFWHFDDLARLADAQVLRPGEELGYREYLRPGVF